MKNQETTSLELPVRALPRWGVPAIAAALQNHELGQFADSALLAEALTQDPRIRAALQMRVKALTGLDIHFTPANGSARAKQIAERAEQSWRTWVPEGDSEALHRWLVLLGVSVGQLLWDRSGEEWTPRLNVWHPTYLYWYWDTERLFGRYQLVVANGGTIEPVPGDGEWVFIGAGQKRPWMEGTLRCLARAFQARYDALNDWARYSEVHGLPTRKGIVPAEADDRLIDEFADGLRHLGSEGVVLLRQGPEGNKFDLELLEAKGDTHSAFKDLIDQASDDITIALLGQNLTTEVSGAGSYAAAKVHNEVRRDLLEADARLMSAAARQILRPWAAMNFGSAELAPELVYEVDPPEDVGEKARGLLTLAQAISALQQAKVPVDVEALLAEAGVPVKRRVATSTVQLQESPDGDIPRQGEGAKNPGWFAKKGEGNSSNSGEAENDPWASPKDDPARGEPGHPPHDPYPPKTREAQQVDALMDELTSSLPKNVKISVDESQPAADQLTFLEQLRKLRDSKVGATLFDYLKAHPEHSVDIRMVDEFKGRNTGPLNSGNRSLPGNVLGKTQDPQPNDSSPGTTTLIEISTTQIDKHNDRYKFDNKSYHSVAEIAAHELGHAIDGIERVVRGAKSYPEYAPTGEYLSNTAACYAGSAYRREIGAVETLDTLELNKDEAKAFHDRAMALLPFHFTKQNTK